MKRTQLYIDDSQFQLLFSISREKKTTVSDLVRRALDKVYGRRRRKRDFIKALNASFGIWKNRTDLPPTDEYVRSLRKDTRWKRFGLS
ncbi:MAG: hypothetical protein HYU99_11680 [Deltaproteobacteria bacterium]|nr:hypothetical protein [Deltaproteobacteria bacterium]